MVQDIKTASALASIVLALLTASPATHAASDTDGGGNDWSRSGCSDGMIDALQAINVKLPSPVEKTHWPITALHCKPWMNKGKRFVAAVGAFEEMQRPGKHASSNDDKAWTVIVALLEPVKQQDDENPWNARAFTSMVFEGDAINLICADSLKVDTAPYRLKRDVLAFGVRYNTCMPVPSSAEGAAGNELTLFVPEGKTLRPVMSLVTSRQELVEGESGKGDRLWRSETMTVQIGAEAPGGWRDLIVNQSIETDVPNQKGDGVEVRRSRASFPLRYNGSRYQLNLPAGKRPSAVEVCCNMSWPIRTDP